MSILISIITPVYNRESVIFNCLESVTLQINEFCEHIVVDDASEDNTNSTVSAYLQYHSHLSLYKLPENRGTNAARNLAISKATGRFILFLDSDDQLAPNSIQLAIQAIERNPDVQHFLFQVDDLVANYQNNSLLAGGEVMITYRDWVNERVSGDFAHLFLREIALQFPFEESLRIYESLTFLQMFKYEERQLYTPHVVIHRDRGRADSVTHTASLYQRNAMEREFLFISQLVEQHGGEMNQIRRGALLKRASLLGAALKEFERVDKLWRKEDKMPILVSISICLARIFPLKRIWMALSYLKHRL